MYIFLSWSSKRHELVLELGGWLHDLLPDLETLYSGTIEWGNIKRWEDNLTARLDKCSHALICLTPQSIQNPLFLFEAGIISTKLGRQNVFAIHFGMATSDASEPFRLFTPIQFESEEIWSVIEKLNLHNTHPTSTHKLRSEFDATWSAFAQDVNRILSREPYAEEDEHWTEDDEVGEGWATSERSSEISREDPVQADRRITNTHELIQRWSDIMLHIRSQIGVTGIAYLHDATPISLTESELVLQFTRVFMWQKATEAADRLPFESVVNEVLDKPRRLVFTLDTSGDLLPPFEI